MKHSNLIIIILAILLINSVMAAPPIFGDFTTGYEIKVPLQDYIRYGDNFTVHAHVYNISNGMPVLNQSTECHFHLYNSSGNHVLVLNKQRHIDDQFDFEFMIQAGNITQLGHYEIVVQCNSSELGGFSEAAFEVTNDGKAPAEQDKGVSIAIVMFIMLVAGFLYALPFIMKEFAKNPYLNNIARRSCWVIATYIMVLNSGIMHSMVSYSQYQFAGEFRTFILIFGWIGYLFMGYLVLSMGLDTVRMWRIKRNERFEPHRVER